MTPDVCDVVAATGILNVRGHAPFVEVDVSDIYPRFIYQGASIDKLMVPAYGALISLQEWFTRASGDPNEFRKLFENGRVEKITFHIDHDNLLMEIIPTHIEPRTWEPASAHESPFHGLVTDGRRPPALPSHKTREDPLDYIWRALEGGSTLYEGDLDSVERNAAEVLFGWGLACKSATPNGRHSFEISHDIKQWIDAEELRERAARYRPAATSMSFEGRSATSPLAGKSIDFIVMDEAMEDEVFREKVALRCQQCAGRGLIRNPYKDDLAECGRCRGSGKVFGYK